MTDTPLPPKTAKASTPQFNLLPKRALVVTSDDESDVAKPSKIPQTKPKRAKLELVWSQRASRSSALGHRNRRQDRVLRPIAPVDGRRQASA